MKEIILGGDMSFLRKAGAILKLPIFFLPGLALAGGLASLIGLSISSNVKMDKAEKLFEETAQYEELKDELISNIEERRELMTEEEYETLKENIDSKGYWKEAMTVNYLEDDEVRALYNKSNYESDISIYFFIPLGAGLISSFAYATDDFIDFLDIKHNWSDDPYSDAEKQARRERKREQKNIKRLKKEEKYYTEEVIDK